MSLASPVGNVALKEERGAILVLAALLMGLLMGLAALYLNVGYTGLMRAEMQSASDAAALAGASALCSSKKCFDDARRLAIETLAREQSHAGLGADGSLQLDPNQPGTEWDLVAGRNLRVHIERGWYLNGVFTSTEDEWQAAHPGVPNFIAANAVRIQIERPQTSISSAVWGNAVYDLRTESIALAAPEQPVCVAPFAVHVCSLIDDDTGEYYGDSAPAEACYGDRLFAQADRYCPSGGCDTMPSFPWNPCSPELATEQGIQATYFPTQAAYDSWRATNCPSCPVSTGPGQYCFTRHGSPKPLGRQPEGYGWNGQQMFKSVHDHFGVVGLPGTQRDQGTLANDIRNLLAGGPNPCRSVRVGDPFTVLQSGLTDPAVDNLIWNAIADGFDPNPDVDHPEMGATPVGTISRNVNYFYYDSPSPQPIFPAGAANGLCNSRRANFPAQLTISGVTLWSWENAEPGIDDTDKVWAVNVAIIADQDGTAGECKGIGASVSDPEIDPGHQYVVIGHARALIYDTDIGKAPPVGFYNALGTDGKYHDFYLDGWGFQQPCNVVRGRMACERPFLPAANGSAANISRLVQ